MTADMRSERHAAFQNIIDFIEGNALDAAKAGPLIDGQGAIGLLMGVHDRSYNAVRKANPLLAARHRFLHWSAHFRWPDPASCPR
jgi:hypothetical protein